MDRFVEKGLVRITEHGIEFAGDERESLYAKYYARKVGGRFNGISLPANVLGAVSTHSKVARESAWQPIAGRFLFEEESVVEEGDLDLAIDALLRERQTLGEELTPENSSRARMLTYHHDASLDVLDEGQNLFLLGSIRVSSTRVGKTIIWTVDSEIEGRGHPISHAQEMKTIANSLGGDIEIRFREVQLPDRDAVWRNVRGLVAGRRQSELSGIHVRRMSVAYVQKRDPDLACLVQGLIGRVRCLA